MGTLDGWTVAFDLDGTLVETAPDLLRALGETLDHAGLAHGDLGGYRMFVGHGARALVERASAHLGVTHAADRLSELTEYFVERYAADIARYSRPYDGVEDALTLLAAEGATLSVCTNKRTGLSVQLLTELGLIGRFAAVVGADSVPARKPDPGHVAAAVEGAGGVLARSVMVGDSATDVAAAKAAGVPSIAMSFGYSDAPVETLGADLVLNAFADVPAAVAALVAKAGGR